MSYTFKIYFMRLNIFIKNLYCKKKKTFISSTHILKHWFFLKTIEKNVKKCKYNKLKFVNFFYY